MITLEITDSTGTTTLEMLEVPLTESTIENAVDVTTLDKNVYTDFINTKRIWAHVWSYLAIEAYEVLRGYYERQFTLYQYPSITINGIATPINDVTVRMTMGNKQIVDNCETVEDVSVGFRETRQLPSGSS